MQHPELWRLPRVLATTGCSRSGWYAAVKAGTAPAPVPISARSRAWLSSEVEVWIAERIAGRAA